MTCLTIAENVDIRPKPTLLHLQTLNWEFGEFVNTSHHANWVIDDGGPNVVWSHMCKSSLALAFLFVFNFLTPSYSLALSLFLVLSLSFSLSVFYHSFTLWENKLHKNSSEFHPIVQLSTWKLNCRIQTVKMCCFTIKNICRLGERMGRYI